MMPNFASGRKPSGKRGLEAVEAGSHFPLRRPAGIGCLPEIQKAEAHRLAVGSAARNRDLKLDVVRRLDGLKHEAVESASVRAAGRAHALEFDAYEAGAAGGHTSVGHLLPGGRIRSVSGIEGCQRRFIGIE